MEKVVVVGSYAPSLINFRGHLLSELQVRGYEVIACAPNDPKVAAALRQRGVSFLAIGPARASLNPIADITYFLRLLATYRRIKPVAVVSYTIKPVIWSSLAASVSGVPNVVSMITGLGAVFTSAGRVRAWTRRLIELLYKISLRRCDRVIFQNPDDQQEFAARSLIKGKGHSFVVNGSGVDLDQFSVSPIPREPVFLLIARFLASKGIREYAEAASTVKRKFPDAQFRLLGWFDGNPTGIGRDELEEWVAAGLIDYRGHLDDVRSEIAAARIYVLPSYYREGTPRTVLEAMAMGRPILTTDMPGCRETVRDGWNGFLVPPRDAHALAAAMERLLANPGLAEQMGARSRQLAEMKYDARAVAVSIVRGVGL